MHPLYQHCYLLKADAGRWIVYGKTSEGLDLMTLDEFSASEGNVIVAKALLVKFRVCSNSAKSDLNQHKKLKTLVPK